MTAIVDWLDEDLTALAEQYQQARLPHGLLLVGHEGDGSLTLLTQLKQLLLCHKPSQRACGQCKACQLIASGHHPDVMTLEPEGKSQTIKVDAIRQMIGKVTETAQQGGNKVVHIRAAEKMNTNAANALLKVLEEPTARTFILLQAEQISQMLPTIRSRCRIQLLSKPSPEQALSYVQQHQPQANAAFVLEMAQQHPLTAVHISQAQIEQWQGLEAAFLAAPDFTALSQLLAKGDMQTQLSQILLWVDSAIRSQQNSQITLASVSEGLLKSLTQYSPVSLFSFRDYIVEKLSAIQRQSNLNAQLMAEELVSRWFKLRGM